MKKLLIFSLSFGLLLSIFSCNDEIIKELQDEYVGISARNTTLRFLRVGDGQPVSAGIVVQLIAAQKSSPVSYTFEIDPSSTAIAGTHYVVNGTTASIEANTSTATLPIQILPDNINPGDVWTLGVKLTGSDLQLASENVVNFRIQVTCPSALAGVVNYSTAAWCGGSSSGTATIVASSAGVYEIVRPDLEGDAATAAAVDWGAYDACYGPGSTLPGGDLKIRDTCNKLTFEGASRWGEVYVFEDISVSANGLELTLVWANDYGEAGTTVLTRADGAAWPNLTK